MRPDIMLFDEVTSALDPELVGEVLYTMRALAETGMTMVVVTHEMGFARDVSDRVAYFHEGIMEEIGPPAQIFGEALSEHTAKFLAKVRKVDKDPTVILQIAAIEKSIKKVKDPNLSPNTPNRELPMGASAQYWLARRAYKHLEIAKALPLPLLVIGGIYGGIFAVSDWPSLPSTR